MLERVKGTVAVISEISLPTLTVNNAWVMIASRLLDGVVKL